MMCFDEQEFDYYLNELCREEEILQQKDSHDDRVLNTSLSSSVSAITTAYARKGGRLRNPSFIPELRIFRRDIRRKYGEMILNIANNHDTFLLQQFLLEFCRPDCIFEKKLPKNPKLKKQFEKVKEKEDQGVGWEEIIQRFTMSNETMPDCVFRMKEYQIRVRQGTPGSVLSSRLIMKGTRVFRVEFKERSSASYFQQPTEETEPCNSPESPYEFIQSIDSNFAIRRILLPSTPKESVMEAALFIALDEFHRIQHFQLIWQKFQENDLTPLTHHHILDSNCA